MKVFNIKEVAVELKTSEEMIRQHIRNKRIKAVKFGRKWMVSDAELNRALTEGF